MSHALQKTETARSIRHTLAGDYFKQQVALALPKHMTPDRFVRVCLTALTRVPKLAQCTEASLIKCMLTCSELGLEPDGRRAHLIPFENKKAGIVECTLIVDYKGLAELAMRSGKISRLHADLICENDEFAYDMGEILHHRIDFKQDRGLPYAAYAMAVTTDGHKFVQVMTQAEIEAIRDRSQGWIAFKKGWAKQSPWQDYPGEQWKKTVFRRLSKWLPLSPEIQDAMDKDSEPVPATASGMMLTLPNHDDVPQPVDGGAESIESNDESPAPQEPVNESEAPSRPEAGKDLPLSPQLELAALLEKEGYTFDHFQKWSEGTGAVENAASYASFDELPGEVCKRLLRARVGLLRGMESTKKGENRS